MASSVNKTDWAKNVARSTKYASVNLVKSAAPTTVSMVEASMAGFGDLKRFLTDKRSTIQNTEKVSENNNKIKSLMNDVMENIRTGNLASDKLSDASDMEYFGFLDDIEGDNNSFFGSDNETLSDDIRSDQITQKAIVESSRIQSRAQIQALKEMTNSINRSHIKASDAISKRTSNLIIGGFSKIDSSLGIINNSLTAINKNIMSLVEYQNNNRYKVDEKQLEFFDEAITSMKKMQATFSMQSDRKYKDNPMDMLSFGFNMGGYKDLVKHNFNNSTLGMTMSMLKMFGGMNGNFIGKFNPTSMALTALLGALMPQKTMKSLTKFDDSINEFTKNTLYRIGDYGKHGNNAITKMLAQLLGASPPTINKMSLDKYKKDAMQWNGKAQKTLVEVIPSYLAKIESALTHQDERFFDLEKGRFNTRTELRKSFNKEIESKVNFAQDDEILDLLDSYLNKQSPSMKAKYTRQMKNMMSQGAHGKRSIYQDINPRMSQLLQTKLGVPKSEAVRIVSSLNKGLYEGIGDINSFYDEISSGKSEVYRYLFNNSSKNYTHTINPFTRVQKTKTDQEKEAEALAKGLESVVTSAKGKVNVGKIKPMGRFDDFASGKLDNLTSFMMNLSTGSDNGNLRGRSVTRPRLGVRYKGHMWRTNNPQEAAAFATVNMQEGFFGKDGVMTKITESEQFKDVKDKTGKAVFGEKNPKTGKYENGMASDVANSMYDASRSFKQMVNGEDFTDTNGKKRSIKGQSMKDVIKGWATQGYGLTMQYLFGDDYKNDKNYNKTFGWLAGLRKGKDAESSVDEVVDNATKSKLGFSSKSIKNSKATGRKIQRAPKKIAPTKAFSSHMSGVFKSSREGETSAATVLHEAAEEAASEIGRFSRITSEVLLGNEGEDADPKKITKKLNKEFLKNVKKKIPKVLAGGLAGAMIPILAGGSMGALGLFLPGNPIGGAIVGTGLSMLYQTDKFQEIMFGKKNEDGERTGGLINKELRAKFKKVLPLIVGGGVIGGLKTAIFGGTMIPGMGVLTGSLLPGSILGGSLIGMASALLWRNEKFQKILFGDKDEDGKRTGGKLSNAMNKASNALSKSWGHIRGGAKGAGIGTMSAAVVGQMGLLGAALTPAGLIGGALFGLGMGIASQTERFKTFLFGEKDEETKKRSHDGFLSRFENTFRVEILDPIRIKADEVVEGTAIWLKKNVSIPFTTAFGPLFNSMKVLGDSISEMVKQTFDKVGEGFTKSLEKVFSPVLFFIMKMLGKSFTAVGKTTEFGLKMVGQVLVSPLKLMSFLAAPSLMKENLGFVRKYVGDKISGVNAQFEGKKPSFVNRLRQGTGILSAITGADDYWDQKEAYGKEKFSSKLMQNAFLIGKTKKQVKDQETVFKATKLNNREVLRLNKQFSRADKRGNGNLLPKEFDKRLAAYRNAGVDTSNIKTADDMYQLTHNYAGFKARSINDDEASKAKVESDKKTDKFRHTITDRLDTIASVLTGKEVKSETKKGRPFLLRKKELDKLNMNEVDYENIWDSALTKQDERKREYDEYMSEATTRANKEGSEGSGSRFLSFKNKMSGLWGSAKTKLDKVRTTTDEEGNTKKKGILGTIASLLGGGLFGVLGSVGGLLSNPLGIGLILGGIIFGGKALGKLLGINWVSIGKAVAGVVTSAVTGVIGLAGAAIRTALGFTGSVKDTLVGTVRSMLGLSDTMGIDAGATDEEGNPVKINDRQQLQEDLLLTVGKAKSGYFKNIKKGSGIFKAISNKLLGKTADEVAGKAGATVTKDATEAVAKTVLRKTKLKDSKNIYKTSGGVIQKVATDAKPINEVIAETNTKAANKLFAAFHTIFENIFKSKIVTKLLGSESYVGRALKGVKNFVKVIFDGTKKNIGNSKVTTILKKGMKKLGSRSTTAIPIIGMVISAGFAIYDVTTGAFEAANLFKIDSDDVDSTMMIVSAFLKWLLGTKGGIVLDILFELGEVFLDTSPKQSIAVELYKTLADDEDEAKLLTAIDDFESSRNQYNQIHGTNLTKYQYNTMINETGIGAVTSLGKSDYSTGKSSSKSSGYGTSSSLSNVTQKETKNLRINSSPIKAYRQGGGVLGYGPGLQQLSQKDGRWSNYNIGTLPNGKKSTMADGGCGPTALSMVANGSTNPLEIARMAKANGYITNGGANSRLFTEGASQLGLSGKQLGTDTRSITSALASGNPVIVSGTATDNNSIFTKAGHIVTLSGYDKNGNVIINDPMRSNPISRPFSSLSGITNSWAYDKSSYGRGVTTTSTTSKAKTIRGVTIPTTSKRDQSATKMKPLDSYSKNAMNSLGLFSSGNQMNNWDAKMLAVKSEDTAGGDPGYDTAEQVIQNIDGSNVTLYNGAVYYAQTDQEWSGITFGKGTIGKYGCILSCFAMALSSLLGKRLTPSIVFANPEYNAFSGGLWQRNDMIRICSNHNLKCVSVNSIGDLKTYLSRRIPCIYFDKKNLYSNGFLGRTGSGSEHAVLLVGMRGDNALVNDPRSISSFKATNNNGLGVNINSFYRQSALGIYAIMHNDGSGINDSDIENISSGESDNGDSIWDKLRNAFNKFGQIGENALYSILTGTEYKSIFDSSLNAGVGAPDKGSLALYSSNNLTAKTNGRYPGFGILSHRYEARNAGMSSVGDIDTNNKQTAGKFQFNGGTIDGFLSSLRQNNGTLYNKYFSKFGSTSFGSGTRMSSDFINAWKSAANDSEFEAAYENYAYNNYLVPAENQFYKKYGKYPSGTSNPYAIREVLFSSAIQHGQGTKSGYDSKGNPSGLSGLFTRIPSSYTSDRDFINAMYNARTDQNSSTASRYSDERNDALSLLQTGYGSGPKSSGSDPDIFSSLLGGKSSSNVINLNKNGFNAASALGFGNPQTGSNVPKLTQKLNVAVNTTGVEDKLDILIGVMREYLGGQQNAGYGNIGVLNYQSGNNSTSKVVAANQKVANAKPPTAGSSNLRKIHDIIAKGVRA